MTRTPFSKESNQKTKLLDVTHSDMCGPMRTASNGKAKYFAIFIDDSSRWCEIRFLKFKDEVFEHFKEFKQFVENQKGRKLNVCSATTEASIRAKTLTNI